MHIAVPGVAKGHGVDSILLRNLPNLLDQGRDPTPWNNDVQALVDSPHMVCRFKETLSALPHPLQGSPRSGNENVMGPIVLADIANAVSTLFQCLLMVSIQRDEQMGGCISESQLPFGVILGKAKAVSFHELNGCGNDPCRDDLRDGLSRIIDRRVGDEEVHPLGGEWDESQGDLSHNAQGALGSNHELREVVPCHVLHHFPTRLNHLSSRKHHLQTVDVIFGGSVSHGPATPGPFGYIAANAAAI